MERNGFRRVARGVTLAVVAGACIALSGGSAMAAHVVGHTGGHGVYSFNDTAGHPSVDCSYEGAAGTYYFNGVKVQPPTVFYPDRSASNPHEHGSVAWQVRIQHLHAGVWTTVKTGALISTIAFENAAAMFSPKVVHWPGPLSSGWFRVLETLTWYNHDASVYGTVTAVLQHYTNAYDEPAGSCKGNTPTKPPH